MHALGRVDEALVIAGELDPYVDDEMGECLFAIGRAEEARPHFSTAYTSLSQDEWFGANEPARLERLRRLAESGVG